MPLYTARFRSVKIDIVQSLQTAKGPSASEKPEMKFDVDGAMRHELVMRAKDFVDPGAWLMGLFFSALGAGFALVVIYGILYLAGAVNLTGAAWGGAEIAYLSSALVLFVSCWAGSSVFLAIRRARTALIERDRGEGNWKLVDEEKWERYTTMLRLAAERVEREREAAKAKAARGVVLR
ncbi:MAG TPA: hypothetical protein PLG31_14495 [Spirochaetota bacterium]|nr:hypothetical protein [Spirochaetota bacterium]HPU90111.1 hypothetical protein [Spirochaetota bacterium]